MKIDGVRRLRQQRKNCGERLRNGMQMKMAHRLRRNSVVDEVFATPRIVYATGGYFISAIKDVCTYSKG